MAELGSGLLVEDHVFVHALQDVSCCRMLAPLEMVHWLLHSWLELSRWAVAGKLFEIGDDVVDRRALV